MNPKDVFVKVGVQGTGGNKIVYKVIDRRKGREVAWNEVNVGDMELSKVIQEVRILTSLDHPHLLRIYESWIDEENFKLIFITELMTSGSLRSFIQSAQFVSCGAVKDWCRQILSGLHYLHHLNPPIIHRDIKLDNIFFHGSKGEVIIGDLGLATVMNQLDVPRSIIGTPEFMAPEFYDENYNEKVDIWAFGLCVVEMITLDYPYKECPNPGRIYKTVSAGIKPQALAKIKDKTVLEFVSSCLEVDVQKRLSSEQLINHPFLCEPSEDNHFIKLHNEKEVADILLSIGTPPTRQSWEAWIDSSIAPVRDARNSRNLESPHVDRHKEEKKESNLDPDHTHQQTESEEKEHISAIPGEIDQYPKDNSTPESRAGVGPETDQMESNKNILHSTLNVSKKILRRSQTKRHESKEGDFSDDDIVLLDDIILYDDFQQPSAALGGTDVHPNSTGKDLESHWQTGDTKKKELESHWQTGDTKKKELESHWQTGDTKKMEPESHWQTGDTKKMEPESHWRTGDTKKKELESHWQTGDTKKKELESHWETDTQEDEIIPDIPITNYFNILSGKSRVAPASKSKSYDFNNNSAYMANFGTIVQSPSLRNTAKPSLKTTSTTVPSLKTTSTTAVPSTITLQSPKTTSTTAVPSTITLTSPKTTSTLPPTITLPSPKTISTNTLQSTITSPTPGSSTVNSSVSPRSSSRGTASAPSPRSVVDSKRNRPYPGVAKDNDLKYRLTTSSQPVEPTSQKEDPHVKVRLEDLASQNLQEFLLKARSTSHPQFTGPNLFTSLIPPQTTTTTNPFHDVHLSPTTLRVQRNTLGQMLNPVLPQGQLFQN